MNFFNLDGPFHKYGTILFDLAMLNLYWLFISVFSFGLLSGPATVSLYKSIHHCVIKQSGTPTKEFFKTFKANFLTSFLGSLVVIFMSATCVVSMLWINNGLMPVWLYPLYFSLLLYIVLVLPYGVGLIAESDLKLKKIFKYSILLAIKHLPTTILLLIISVAGIGILYLQPVAILIIASPVALGHSYFLSDRVLVNYDTTEFN